LSGSFFAFLIKTLLLQEVLQKLLIKLAARFLALLLVGDNTRQHLEDLVLERLLDLLCLGTFDRGANLLFVHVTSVCDGFLPHQVARFFNLALSGEQELPR